MSCLSDNCFKSLTFLAKINEIYKRICDAIPCPTFPVYDTLAADQSETEIIPAAAQSWTLTVSGANGSISINGEATAAVADGFVLSGQGPLNDAILATTGETTTVDYAYETCTDPDA